MATIKRELSGKRDSMGRSEIILRVSVCRGIQPRIRSGLYLPPARFNREKGAIVMPRANQKEVAELRKIENDLIKIERHLLNLCVTLPKEQLNKDTLTAALYRFLHPIQDEKKDTAFYDVFETFLKVRHLSEWRIKHYEVLKRSLKRFELYLRAEGQTDYTITLDAFSDLDIRRFEDFLRNEPSIAEKHPAIYAAHPADTRKARKTPKPQPKGNNTIVCIFSRLRAFFNWCNDQDLTDNKPFAKYTGVTVERYGTPYYITLSERDKIAAFDLSAVPPLEIQRDIFIFHCLIGCRVSDLIRLTPSNIVNGAVEYIASKTKEERPTVIRVPLHRQAVALVKKYAGVDADGRLFPFITPQRYNDAIKHIFTICGITRVVTVLNPTSGQEEQRPINEIASSHIARRTFIGNLYKKVKDPNLIGALSGHKEGSRAFVRYRDIDEDTKRDVINLLGD